MKLLFKIALILVLFFNVIACNNPPKLNKPETQFGTNGEDLSVFHKIAENDLGLSLRFPGFIVGIEKAYRSDIGLKGCYLFNCDDIDDIKENDFNSPSNYNKVRAYLNDPKRSFVSHVRHYFLENNESNISYIKEDATTIPTIYDKNFQLNKTYPTVYQKSFDALNSLKKQINIEFEKAKAIRAPYTHIFLYSMGWNTDQQESFRNFNSLMTQVIENKPKDVIFKPLFIGLSWPSEWTWDFLESLGKAISYPTKADDADEVGFLWGNHIIRNILVPLKYENKIPLIIIGHSFGARLLSRSIFSLPLSKQIPYKTDVDLFVGLQGAFSVNRFIEDEGNEGSPYQNFKNYARKFVFTWSNQDTANPMASYITGAEHIGGSKGYEKTKNYPDIFDQFQIIVKKDTDQKYDYIYDGIDNKEKWKISFNNANKISMIDASNLIFHHPYHKGGNAHSDIYSPGVAKLIWDAIDNLPHNP